MPLSLPYQSLASLNNFAEKNFISPVKPRRGLNKILAAKQRQKRRLDRLALQAFSLQESMDANMGKNHDYKSAHRHHHVKGIEKRAQKSIQALDSTQVFDSTQTLDLRVTEDLRLPIEWKSVSGGGIFESGNVVPEFRRPGEKNLNPLAEGPLALIMYHFNLEGVELRLKQILEKPDHEQLNAFRELAEAEITHAFREYEAATLTKTMYYPQDVIEKLVLNLPVPESKRPDALKFLVAIIVSEGSPHRFDRMPSYAIGLKALIKSISILKKDKPHYSEKQDIFDLIENSAESLYSKQFPDPLSRKIYDLADLLSTKAYISVLKALDYQTSELPDDDQKVASRRINRKIHDVSYLTAEVEVSVEEMGEITQELEEALDLRVAEDLRLPIELEIPIQLDSMYGGGIFHNGKMIPIFQRPTEEIKSQQIGKPLILNLYDFNLKGIELRLKQISKKSDNEQLEAFGELAKKEITHAYKEHKAATLVQTKDYLQAVIEMLVLQLPVPKLKRLKALKRLADIIENEDSPTRFDRIPLYAIGQKALIRQIPKMQDNDEKLYVFNLVEGSAERLYAKHATDPLSAKAYASVLRTLDDHSSQLPYDERATASWRIAKKRAAVSSTLKATTNSSVRPQLFLFRWIFDVINLLNLPSYLR